MTPYLRKLIDAAESAQLKKTAADLTDIEKIALCFTTGVELIVNTKFRPIQFGSVRLDGEGFAICTKNPVAFVKDGSWRVVELKD